MQIEIENEAINITTITSRKTGGIFYVAEQNALAFKDDSKYPEHFTIRHCFTEDKREAEEARPLSKGRYQLRDSAYSIDRFKNLTVDVSPKNLRNISTSAIPSKAA